MQLSSKNKNYYLTGNVLNFLTKVVQILEGHIVDIIVLFKSSYDTSTFSLRQVVHYIGQRLSLKSFIGQCFQFLLFFFITLVPDLIIRNIKDIFFESLMFTV